MQDLPPAPRTALVFGGSRGIGAAAVRRLAEDGHAVAFTYLANPEAAEALAADAADAAAFRELRHRGRDLRLRRGVLRVIAILLRHDLDHHVALDDLAIEARADLYEPAGLAFGRECRLGGRAGRDAADLAAIDAPARGDGAALDGRCVIHGRHILAKRDGYLLQRGWLDIEVLHGVAAVAADAHAADEDVSAFAAAVLSALPACPAHAARGAAVRTGAARGGRVATVAASCAERSGGEDRYENESQA